MRSLVLPAAAALLALAACGKSPCEELGNRICSCGTSSTTSTYGSTFDPSNVVLDTCNNAVKTQLGSSSPSGADEQACQGFLATCPGAGTAGFCAQLQTAQGKVNCGMSYSPAP
ncbi:MAG TPA: hypothetical protein VFE30_07205 [Anaeromyxobacteraceae bacterium]|nr:hypothetical protein [Anaeromyxobacteraceae bacterium]